MLYLTDKSGPGLSVIEIAARDEALRRAHALLHAVGRTEEWSKDWTSASGQVLALLVLYQCCDQIITPLDKRQAPINVDLFT
eukprot:3595807-Pleurochrysis_carterae.AAC.3